MLKPGYSIGVFLLTGALTCAAQVKPANPTPAKPEPTAAELKLTIAQQKMQILGLEKEVKELQFQIQLATSPAVISARAASQQDLEQASTDLQAAQKAADAANKGKGSTAPTRPTASR